MQRPDRIFHFLLTCLTITLFQPVVPAQNNLTTKSGATQPQPVSALAESDRVRDGLAGPVRRVRTEVAKLASAGGRTAEDKHVVLEVASYDPKGGKTENQYFPITGSTLTGKEVYKYDEKGNISEMTVVNDKGSLLSKEVYKYEYDSVGNWIRMTTSVAVIEAGNVTFEPTEVTYRSITYYLDENMLKMAQPAVEESAKNAPTEQRQQPVAAEARVQPSGSSNKLPQNQTNTSKTAQSLPGARTSGESLITNNQPSLKTTTASEMLREPVVVMGSEPPPAAAPKPILKPLSGGVLNGRALSLPLPVYPEAAKRSRSGGIVEIGVVVDETGKVISAKALSGPIMLRDAALQAALKAKFSPTLLSGQPVKVSGLIDYKFSLSQ